MTFYFWLGFLLLVFILLALDLGVFHKKDKAISTKEALLWTGFWIFLALLFNVFIYFAYEYHWLGIGLHVGHDMGGKEAAIKYFTGYVIEKSLSLDNIFVIAMIFAYFRVPDIYQHRVLFWGILGALIMRGIMIYAGAALIDRFDWMIYVFGGLLILTAIKMLISKDEEIHPDENPLVKLARRLYPVTGTYEGHHFFTHLNGKRAITPLFLVLLVIESTDVIFAVDSIPAIFAITTDPYIVFTSNVFAILGLRSLYFALAAMMNKFRYLKISIVVVLIFVGVKMLISELYHIPTLFSLGVIILILGFGVAVSLLQKDKN
ncbi:MAG: TerC family protein [Melioribacteraceae bacterium]|nr:MAG: TerC family protein [Melioribacteraceae bacterium]